MTGCLIEGTGRQVRRKRGDTAILLGIHRGQLEEKQGMITVPRMDQSNEDEE
jgi:hypothetical protein